jgi:UPF0755 protein
MRARTVLLVLLLAIATGAVAGILLVRARLAEAYKGYEAPEVFVEVPAGAGPAAIGRRLVDAGVVRDRSTFRMAVWASGQARNLKAGEYRFSSPLSAPDVVDLLARGEVYERPVTFPEGLTIRDMARTYEAAGLGRAASFEQAARDTRDIRDLDPRATDLEGYLFPETYRLGREVPPGPLVAHMTAQFRKVFTPALRAAAEARGLTVREAVTLASLVEKETAVAEERPLVAAVYLNRRRRGMPMQADPTVIYALARAGRFDGNLRRDDLLFDSPYNTYRYPGLPPGPIANPGRAALEAAVAPAPVDYLYFVSRNDGSHVFARTLAEHNRNVERWQVRYFRGKSPAGRR